MSFNKIDAFIGKRNNAIYFEPDNYLPFCDIRKSYKSLAEQILMNTTEEWDFHPHLTLINRLSGDSAQLMLKEIRSQPMHFTYILDRVCLYKKEIEDDSWQEIAQNKLS